MNKKEIEEIIKDQSIKLYDKEICSDCSDAIYRDLENALPDIIRILIQEQHNLSQKHD